MSDVEVRTVKVSAYLPTEGYGVEVSYECPPKARY
jgi:hypothetical protein